MNTTIVSEGGFFSNPEIHASPRSRDYPIRDLLLKYKVYGSGKHRKQDLLISVLIITEKKYHSDFSVIVKREGFFNRVFGGENVQLGNRSLNDQLLIRASNPALVQSYLSNNNFQVALGLSSVSDLKECKLDLTDKEINLIIRSNHTNVRYVDALLDLVSIITNVDSSYSKPKDKSFFGSASRRIFEKIPTRRQRFKDLSRDASYERSFDVLPEPITADYNQDLVSTSPQDIAPLERVKEKIQGKCYLATEYDISSTSAKLSFNLGYFKDISFNWDSNEIQVMGVKELSMIPFRILMKSQRNKKENSGFHDSFEGINVSGNPKELITAIKERYEIARSFNMLIGNFPPTVEITSDSTFITLTFTAPAVPENIDPIYDLIQNVGWFLEFSFLV